MMSNDKNFIQTFGRYVKSVVDRDGNGIVTVKEIMGVFPSQAIAIAVIVVDLAVLVAEYRVFDFGMKFTDGNIFKSLGFVLVSAIPFYLGQIFWLYPRANTGQKGIALALVIGGLWMSANFGLADLTLTVDVVKTSVQVVNFTAALIGLTIVYILIDPAIKAWRIRVKARANAQEEADRQATIRFSLAELQKTMKAQDELIRDFGKDAVTAQLGTFGKAVLTYNQDADTPEEPKSKDPTTGQDK